MITSSAAVSPAARRPGRRRALGGARRSPRDAARSATAVHKTDRLAELVCSNSFRGDKLDNAVGLLKEEMRRLGSLVMRVADESRVPGGGRARRGSRALRVWRHRGHRGASAHDDLYATEIQQIPRRRQRRPVIIATGPLTSDALSAESRVRRRDHLYFYDAISPIVLAETIDRTKVFRASRWGRSLDRCVGPRGGHDDAGEAAPVARMTGTAIT